MSKRQSGEKSGTESLGTDAAMPSLSQFQKYTIDRVKRGDLKNAPYNPRSIDDKAKKRLKKVVAKMGLVEPLVWNRRSGNIVGGHQRISILDSLEGSSDYSLEVAVVDLDEKSEMEANVALNNTESQGIFDLDKLSTMFKEHKLDIESTGFDMAGIMQMFGENPLEAPGVDLDKMAEQLAHLREASKVVREMLDNASDPDYYAVVVFKDYKNRLRFTSRMGLDDNRYIDGSFIAEKMGIDIETPVDAEMIEVEAEEEEA